MGDEVKNLIDSRTNKYGEFNENAKLSQQMYDIVQTHPGWGRLDYGKRHAMYMILHKISRIVEGDPEYDDNWIDIQGYAKLAQERLKPNQKKKADSVRIINPGNAAGPVRAEGGGSSDPAYHGLRHSP